MNTAERRPLTRDGILRAALTLADDHGLEALSMRKLGAALGVEAMSLYNHVDSKDDVLDGVLDQVMREIAVPDPDLAWVERVRALVREVRRVALDHPGVLPLFATHPIVTVEGFAPVSSLYQMIEDGGFADGRALDAFVFVAAFIMGFLRLDQARLTPPRTDLASPYGNWIGTHDEQAVWLGSSLAQIDWDDKFEASLALMIEALEALDASPVV